MEKVKFISFTDQVTQTTSEHAIITIDGGFITMPKAVYEAQQAAQATLVTESAPTA